MANTTFVYLHNIMYLPIQRKKTVHLIISIFLFFFITPPHTVFNAQTRLFTRRVLRLLHSTIGPKIVTIIMMILLCSFLSLRLNSKTVDFFFHVCALNV